MAGVPHIGLVGPAPDSDDTVDDIFDSDIISLENVDDIDGGKLDWSFVPNRTSYRLTSKPTDNSVSETKVDFYIRISEGCDADVGDAAVSKGRDPKYVMSADRLMQSFRHCEVFFTTPKDPSETSVRLLVDGKEQPVTPKSQDNVTELLLEYQSDPFLNFDRGRPYLLRQKYRVKITKEVDDADGKRVTYVRVLNQSPKTKMSTIPQLKGNESEEECRKRMLAFTKKTDSPETDPLLPQWNPPLYKIEGENKPPGGNRYGYLLEFFMSEKLSSTGYPITEKDKARITNAVFDTSALKESDGVWEGAITFRDHATFLEEIPKLKEGSSPSDFLAKLGMQKKLAETLESDMKYKHLTKFQEDSIEKIQDAVKGTERDTVLISARTGGGKTEAFMIPILEKCLSDDSMGTKAIIFYPTKPLANDQASRFIKVLYHLNKRLQHKLTLGILHGDIPKNEDDVSPEKNEGLPFECPECGTGLLRPTDPKKLVCDNEKCKQALDFVWAYTRPQIYSSPPDILITNPDTLVWDLMVRPHHHSIFGRPVYACKDCGMTYAPAGRKASCNAHDGCNGKNLEQITPCPPSFLVYDEVHLCRGSFGINCSFVSSRIEYMIKKYAETFHKDYQHTLTKIGSSATIANGSEFVTRFFNSSQGKYWLVPENNEKSEDYYEAESDKTLRRHHVYTMPYAYPSESTVGLAIQYLQERAKNGKPPVMFEEKKAAIGNYLQTLAFVNAVKSSNALITQVRRTVAGDLPDLQVDGHTTDFDHVQRSKVERDFNKGSLHVVFATSTLEVGVDFRKVDCIVINGFPYSFNDYLQRIGRGGRQGDSIVLTVCQNWKPIDHYYYSNGIHALKKQHANIEPIPITRDNTEAIKKHLQGAVFDYIMRNKDTDGFDMDNISSIASIAEGDKRQDLNREVFESVNIPDAFQKQCLPQLDQFVSEITQEAHSASMSGRPKGIFYRFLNDWNPRWNLSSLRSTEPDVAIEVFWQ